MKDIKIVVPGGCNAKCAFCFAKAKIRTCSYWVDKLYQMLGSIAPEFSVINITGGEPSISSFLPSALNVIKIRKEKFEKIVMTTNASNLDPGMLEDVVDHLNISRHHFSDEINREIFGTDKIPSAEDLKGIIAHCNIIGIDVTISATITDKLRKMEDVFSMIDLCKTIGASALKIRKDYAIGLKPSKLERMFENIKPTHQSSCPVCRSKTQLISGLSVIWSAGVLEPSKVLPAEEISELIFQPNGRLTLDYAGEKTYDPTPKRIYAGGYDFTAKYPDTIPADCSPSVALPCGLTTRERNDRMSGGASYCGSSIHC